MLPLISCRFLTSTHPLCTVILNLFLRCITSARGVRVAQQVRDAPVSAAGQTPSSRHPDGARRTEVAKRSRAFACARIGFGSDRSGRRHFRRWQAFVPKIASSNQV
jgi:hypothetical protein